MDISLAPYLPQALAGQRKCSPGVRLSLHAGRNIGKTTAHLRGLESVYAFAESGEESGLCCLRGARPCEDVAAQRGPELKRFWAVDRTDRMAFDSPRYYPAAFRSPC